jgi:hypothetical protein
MICYDCDGYGYIAVEDRLDYESTENYAVGESVDWSWPDLRLDADHAGWSLCPYCDGTGKETK